MAGIVKGKYLFAISLVLGILLLTGWSEENIVEGNNMFAFDLYRELSKKDGNLFFSPYSISTTLAIAYAGARCNTEAQMADVLHFVSGQTELHALFSKLIKKINAVGEKKTLELNVANALWGQEGYKFLASFVGIGKNDYEAEVREVNFKEATEEARLIINNWVENKTKSKIKELIKPGVLKPLTRLVLTNAIYFKGKWASQFKKEDTEELPFTLETGEEIKVPMMSQTGDFNYAENETLQILEMPYVDRGLSMIVFLPKKEDGLEGLERAFICDNVRDWLSTVHPAEAVVSFPRFKMTDEFSLSGVLPGMGMSDAFSPGLADFSGMTGNKDLSISEVVHKAFVEVNEEGTEAALATGGVMGLTAMPPAKKIFRADRPFIYIIRDNNYGSILFIGRIMDPR